MKLVRFGPKAKEKPGLIDAEGNIRDLSGEIDDLAGDTLNPESLDRLRALDPTSLPLVEGSLRIGPCVANVGNFIAIGMNYADHAAEAGLEVPPEPVIFFKSSGSVCGPNDDIERPRNSQKLDWEVELGAVIGKTAKYVDEADAYDYVAGYCAVNDVSEREFQLERPGQWTKGKSHDTFGPIGPWLVTHDEVGDPQKLAIWLDVNGERMQESSTANMVYHVPHLVSYLSQFMTLHPGDIISTGTAGGIGNGMKPPRFLQPGDVVQLSVEGLGEQKNKVIQA